MPQMHKHPLAALVASVATLTGCADKSGSEDPGNDPAECCTVTIEVNVPEGTGPVYLAGSLASLGPWTADGLLMSGDGTSRTALVTAPSGRSWSISSLSEAGTRRRLAPPAG